MRVCDVCVCVSVCVCVCMCVCVCVRVRVRELRKNMNKGICEHLRKSYCAQCWSYHSVVYFWPDWDDVWPECFYRDGYVQCTAGVDGADREGDCAYVDRPLCSFYVRGCCKFGDDCWYRHAKRVELLGSHAQGKLSRLGSLESVHLHLCLQVATPGDPGAGGLGFDGNLLRACCCKLPDFCVQIACTLLK